MSGQLIGISSPFAKSGPLWDLFTKYFGKDDDRVLVCNAPSRVMNPTIPEALVQDALERDEAAAKAEWLGIFRDDLASYVSPEALRALVVPGRGGLPPEADAVYVAFVDAATGSGQDSMTLCIAHCEMEEATGRILAVVDALLERRPPFNPELVVMEFAQAVHPLASPAFTGIDSPKGGSTAPSPAWGFSTRPARCRSRNSPWPPWPSSTASNSNSPASPVSWTNSRGSSAGYAPGGHESIDHAPVSGAHDDVANAVCGAVVLAHRDGRLSSERLVS